MSYPRRNRFIVQATLGYALFATLWIFFSDNLLERFADPSALTRLSTAKGFVFIAITALLLFIALRTVPPEQEFLPAGIAPVAGPRRVLLAIAMPLIAFGLQWIFWETIQPFAWLLFFPAVFFSSWLGGALGGIIATALSLPLVWYFFLPPHLSFAVESLGSIMAMGVFMGSGVLFSLIHERLRQAEKQAADIRFRGLVEQSLVGMYIIQDSRFRYVNPCFATIFGYASPADLIDSMHVNELVMPEDRERVTQAMRRRIAGEAMDVQYGFAGMHRDGRTIHVEVHGRAVEYEGKPAVIGVLLDVTERKQTEAHRKLAAEVFEQSGEGIMITDANHNIIFVNNAFSAITGYSEAEALGRNPRMLSSGRQDRDFYRTMWASIDKLGHWQGELWNRRKNGSQYPEWLSVSRVRDASGTVQHYLGIFSDLSRNKAAEAHIQRLEHFDALTGLPNRALLKDRAKHDLSAAHRNGKPLALLFLDLDHFKNINDSLGHSVGDALLVELAQRLNSVVREQDTVSRLGGDEFILVLPDTDADGAAHVAEKLLEAMVLPYQIEQEELTVTLSIGIAVSPRDGSDFDSLFRCADTAMYRAKKDGRNNFRFFAAEMQAHSERTLQLGNALRRALERGQLQLYYQPQISLQSERIIGAEALLRWRHPELGMIPPAEFIPIAEDSGLILPIGEWVLRTAARQCKQWIDSGLGEMTVAVNLSAVQFRHPRLPDLVMQILDEVELPPRYLELELTESVALEHPLEAIAMLDKLHKRGIRTSVDDFGTGYSSLSYLKRFKVYKLKIDQSFVRDIADDPEDKAIVSAIIILARSLGMQTIAEGVENEEQLAFLRGQGCNDAQGYYLGRPMPAEQFEALARAKSAERLLNQG
jgi:diguanylate cyclase (GGDEF)-like protein/PAS domain S-box-containing protein